MPDNKKLTTINIDKDVKDMLTELKEYYKTSLAGIIVQIILRDAKELNIPRMN